MSNSDNHGLEKAYVKRKQGISAVWLVPLIAFIFGGWLLAKSIMDRGTFITVQFDNARGIVIGKTQVRYKGLTAGVVNDIDVSEDLQSVKVEIEMVASATKMLTDKTLFWYVTADVSFQGVSGLDTLFSGSYINVQPDFTGEGKPQREFIALKEAPIPDQSTPGLHITLLTETLGSLDKDSPVTFKQITVGHVSGFKYSETSKKVEVTLFIEPEYAHLVKENSRFWNASGFEVKGSITSGIQVNTESLASIISGGVAFDDPAYSTTLPAAKNGQQFALHSDFQTAEMGHEIELEMQWNSGIDDGASIRYQGLTLGKIVSLKSIDPEGRKVVAIAKVNPRVSPYLTTETQFYVVEPNINLGGTTNMHSLMLGAHIGVRPSLNGEATTKFKVFNQQPAYKYTEPGIHLVLTTSDFNSLNVGTGIYYKQQQVGSVQAIEQVEADKALIHIHVEEAYEHYVTAASRFWNTSGVKVKGGLQGFEFQARSIQSLLAGGIEFDRKEANGSVTNGDTFVLYKDKNRAKQSVGINLTSPHIKGLSESTRLMFRGEHVGNIHQVAQHENKMILQAGILPKYKFILRENTHFWLVKPELSLAGLTDTDAIFGGSYINVDLGTGESRNAFTLATQPQAKHVTAPGLQLTINALNNSGILAGSAIRFKGLTVGQVDSVTLEPSGKSVNLSITIDKQYQHLITSTTRFYNASGITMTGGITNFVISTDTVDSIIKGGLSFYNPEDEENSSPAPANEGEQFSLFATQQQAQLAGTAISIHFNNIEGLQPNQKIKYQDQIIGQINRIEFDTQGYGATAYGHLHESYHHLAVTKSKFWLVKASLGLVNSTNIKNLAEGDFIQVLPGSGNKQTHFQAEDIPPAINALPYGLNITVTANKLGSVRVGNPVLYRQVVVGEVIGVELADTADSVVIYLNIADRYAPLVQSNSKFWNISGFEIEAGVFSGINIDSESIESLLAGGIAFATPEKTKEQASDIAHNGQRFRLHEKVNREWLSWSPKLKLNK